MSVSIGTVVASARRVDLQCKSSRHGISTLEVESQTYNTWVAVRPLLALKDRTSTTVAPALRYVSYREEPRAQDTNALTIVVVTGVRVVVAIVRVVGTPATGSTVMTSTTVWPSLSRPSGLLPSQVVYRVQSLRVHRRRRLAHSSRQHEGDTGEDGLTHRLYEGEAGGGGQGRSVAIFGAATRDASPRMDMTQI